MTSTATQSNRLLNELFVYTGSRLTEATIAERQQEIDELIHLIMLPENKGGNNQLIEVQKHH